MDQESRSKARACVDVCLVLTRCRTPPMLMMQAGCFAQSSSARVECACGEMMAGHELLLLAHGQ